MQSKHLTKDIKIKVNENEHHMQTILTSDELLEGHHRMDDWIQFCSIEVETNEVKSNKSWNWIDLLLELIRFEETEIDQQEKDFVVPNLFSIFFSFTHIHFWI